MNTHADAKSSPYELAISVVSDVNGIKLRVKQFLWPVSMQKVHLELEAKLQCCCRVGEGLQEGRSEI